MGLQWRYDLTIMVDEVKKPDFHQKLVQYLTNAKIAGDIVSATGTCQPIEVPEKIEV